MTNINTHYKATVADPTSTSNVPQAPDYTELQEQIQVALTQIESFEYADYLTEEQLAELNRLKTMLKAESAAIAGSGITGQIDPSALGGQSYWSMPTELQPEWNGIPPDGIHTDASDGDAGSYGAALIDDPNVEFAGTVVIPNSGDMANPTMIGFQMTDDMVALTTESKGRDIVLTVTYQDGTKRAWVIREGTVRREPIIISATGLSHGVTIDCSRTIRVSDGSYANYPYGARSGFYIHGSEYNDTIMGTQGDDGIVGWAGDDKIDGMAGNDTIYGDEEYETSGQSDMNYGGNDEIKGGAGYDLIYAGGGEDTPFLSDKGEAVNETENAWVNDLATAAPDESDWFWSSDDSWKVNGMQDGMVVVENATGEGGNLRIDMPPGYNMAYAEMDDSQNLIITFVGDAGTMKVMVKNFFSQTYTDEGHSVASKIINLEFVGSDEDDIIDFSQITLQSQAITIKGGNGNDIIMNARYQMLSDGLNPNDLLNSQGNSEGNLISYAEQGVLDPTSEDKYEATANGGVIEITGDGPGTGNVGVVNGFKRFGLADNNPGAELGIVAPAGYETAYITYDDAGNIYVILVDKGTGGDSKSIVFKIDADALGLTAEDIGVYSKNMTGELTPLSPIYIDPYRDSYMIDGGEGSDFILTQSGGAYTSDEEDYVAEGEFDYNAINGYSTEDNQLGSAPAADDPPVDDPPADDPPADDPPADDPPADDPPADDPPDA